MVAWKLIGIDGEPLTIVHGSYEKAERKANQITEISGRTVNIIPSV